MLNIARNLYSAWNTSGQKNSELNEAEVIPIGESANEKKKLISVTKKYTVIQEHENIPLPGFTLFKTDRKNWGSLDQTWLIIDPRGFLVRITNDNLEMILHVTGITEGLIQQKCVWAREDSQTKMILVPVSSDKYIEAVKNTELIEGKVDMKDVQIGDKVILQNKLQGKYMGVASLYGTLSGYSKEYKPQVMIRRQIVQVAHGKYHYQTDLKILKVVKKTDTPMTREESVAEMEKDILEGTSYFTSSTDMRTGYYSSYGMVRHASIHAVPKIKLKFEEITQLEATALFYDQKDIGDCGQLMLEDGNGDKFLIDVPYPSSTHPITIQSFCVSTITEGSEDGSERINITGGRTYYGGRNLVTFGLDKFKKFYKIVKCVKSETYV